MNGIYIGANKATKIYAGDKEVTKIYKGTELVYESTPLVLPVKGDTIDINCGEIYGVKPFRVIGMNGTKALVSIVTPDNSYNGKYDGSGQASQVYPGSTIDTGMVDCLRLYFSEQFQNACEFFESTMYQVTATTSWAQTKYTWVKQNGTTTHLAFGEPSRGSENFLRKIRIISIEDIITFLNGIPGATTDTSTLTFNNITNMLFGTNEQVSVTYWFMNASTRNVYYFNRSDGSLSTASNSSSISTSRRVIPVFNINLSKIPFTIETQGE